VVVKRYNVKNLFHALRRALKPLARFRRAWINGQRLHFLNIPTPRPLALVEERLGPWRGVAYLVTEDCGDVDLLAEITASGLSDKRCAQITTIFTSLQRAGLMHGDTKASNFLIWQDQVFLIDLDGMTENPAGLSKDLERFLRNWDNATRRRFEEAFQEAGLV
jgi:tRNA A-37 threonylcarbamoyl transferase component Bud32